MQPSPELARALEALLGPMSDQISEISRQRSADMAAAFQPLIRTLSIDTLSPALTDRVNDLRAAMLGMVELADAPLVRSRLMDLTAPAVEGVITAEVTFTATTEMVVSDDAAPAPILADGVITKTEAALLFATIYPMMLGIVQSRWHDATAAGLLALALTLAILGWNTPPGT